ncbi:MAG: hypothetical protein COX62_04230 [Deltaproteobacteria bacterium CG_4_10_14_0_2_um_filter_43_8]|nr:MAG: hypothetical protein COV43_04215 [Deltaproteobacteria bacterium CG11_big_fil_rev_8_21_14_0_20_42_23]PJA20677.1 MAG: hypothetical protein COX62_04230 [Deltaproteobacteria bacterium CG_4_10_14_0_2_um_filter_43_8]PJC64475.1 MAG: hypothetical protein CO021_04030 [Deltaproteobacteria bacterium CG_4_9_14_0_2_um_filter_42_21]
MVLNELIQFWQEDSNVNHIFKRFDEMLKIGKGIIYSSTQAIFESPSNAEELGKQLKTEDAKINKLHQEIRRDIITHISLHGDEDILPCLLLISLIKDAERIGDYGKNIFEVWQRYPHLSDDPLKSSLKTMQENLMRWFDETQQTFDNSDKALAKKVRQEIYTQEKECDRIVWDLASGNQGGQAVAIALEFRFLKRVTAHLGNICSSVIMPFDKVDYHD